MANSKGFIRVLALLTSSKFMSCNSGDSLNIKQWENSKILSLPKHGDNSYWPTGIQVNPYSEYLD